MIFELEKTFRFEAGHSLEHHDGKCKGPHGHSYILSVIISSSGLIPSGPKTNMVMDFSDLSAVVEPMIEKYLDHHWLNNSLGSESATVEFMAKWIFEYLDPLLPGLSAITLNETHTSKVTFRKMRSP